VDELNKKLTIADYRRAGIKVEEFELDGVRMFRIPVYDIKTNANYFEERAIEA